jgi:hypothetical protein
MLNFLELRHGEVRRILLPRTPVNKPVILFATNSSRLVATKIIHLGDVLAAFGCYFSGLGERKYEIVGQIAEPRKGTLWWVNLRVL